LIVARAVNYSNAGTVEFLLAPDRSFYFLEINPRLQVRASGDGDGHRHRSRATANSRRFRREARDPPGGREAPRPAIECRLYAEDPANRFLPQAARIRAVSAPSGPGVRVDSALWAGARVTIDYDPMLAKVIAHRARSRDRSPADDRRARRFPADSARRTTCRFCARSWSSIGSAMRRSTHS